MSLEQSLRNVSGDWAGGNRMRLMPTDDYAETEATMSIDVVAQGNAATVAYTWADGTKPQDGVLLLVNGERSGSIAAVWVDSCHQHPQWMNLEGVLDDGVIRLEGGYSGGG